MTTHIPLYRFITPGLALALGIAFVAHTATAHPYATCLTNSSGTLSFRLNEAADSVKVIWNGGSSSFSLGPVARGLTVTNVGATSPFQVEVKKTGTGAVTRISDDANSANQFEYPRAVAVNKRPASPYFGRIYVGNAREPYTTATGRPCGDGIYILNADCTDAVGQGNTALKAGINMAAGGNSMPWRIRVGADDDMLYICDWSDAAGNLWQTDPNVSAASGTNVFMLPVGTMASPLDASMNHGSITEVYVTGSLAGGNLTVYSADEDYETTPGVQSELNSLWRYDVGAGPLPWSAYPNAKVASPAITGNFSQVLGLDRGTNGYLYFLDSRFAGGENCLDVIDPSGPTVVYQSNPDSLNLGLPNDYLSNCVSVAVSPDLKYCAAQRANAGEVIVIPMVNGIPDLANRVSFNAGTGTTGRQIAFDAADNLYVVSNGAEWLRVFSLGLTTTATTGSDGSFSLVTPGASVTVTADVNTVYEAGPTTAVLTITRANTLLGQPLTVTFTTSGDAVHGTDFVLQTNGVTFTANGVTIPAGSASVNVSVVALNDTESELTETLTFALQGSSTYGVGGPGSQSVVIVDNDPATADLEVVYGSMYERLSGDYVRLQVVRRGDTNAASFTVNLTYSGTAAPARYTAPATVTVDPSEVTKAFDITSPVDDKVFQGDQTIVCSVASGSGYVVGTNTPAVTATLVDDEDAPETVLWSENFNTDNSAAWTLRTGSGNGIDDYRYIFSYDYTSGASIAAIPAAPHSTSDTRGLYLTVNKDEASLLGAAGVNLYPNGKSFSGNYALRFDMYLMVGNAAYTTEHALFGINHSGTKTNWFRNAGGPAGSTFDGLFCGVEADGAGYTDYGFYSGPTTAANNPTVLASAAATAFEGIFKNPPFGGNILPGAPACTEGTATPCWVDVELRQVQGIVTLKIDHTTILTYANTAAPTSGNIMLGYCDSFDSLGGISSGVVFDNLRVISLESPRITSIQVVAGNVQVDFSANAGDTPAQFKLQSATPVAGPYADVTATITALGGGQFRASTPVGGTQQFYRIKRVI